MADKKVNRSGAKRKRLYPGESAPDFCATAVIHGRVKEISRSDYIGRYLVLIFFPMDSYVCQTEIIAFNERLLELKRINCEVVACSTDSYLCHRAWLNTDREHGGVG
ncbi:peroxiredoxin-1-like [Centruroides vittatus]|uniref:peroxiredoxin-1-like n=1 Tax=Centruroides vittatus TaxID=120091 RepID=UPI00350FAB08